MGSYRIGLESGFVGQPRPHTFLDDQMKHLVR
jgi:hypothetical protein